jgi:hypothetical protein
MPPSDQPNRNLANQARGDVEKVGTILQAPIPGIDQPEIGFTDQRTGLQQVIPFFAHHVPVSQMDRKIELPFWL